MTTPSYRRHLPALSWNGNTIVLGGPLDGARSYPLPRGSTLVEELENGERDGACEGLEYYLDGVVDYIPGETLVSGPYAGVTGWDAAAGWEAFLTSWAWRRETFYWLPIAGGVVSYPAVLVTPDVGDFPESEDDGTRRLALRLRSPIRIPFLGY